MWGLPLSQEARLAPSRLRMAVLTHWPWTTSPLPSIPLYFNAVLDSLKE